MDTFAPNVILTGLAVRDRLRVAEVSVPHRARRAGVSSLTSLPRLALVSAKALRQTLRAAFRRLPA
jgi:hypothetical protein